MIIKGALRDKVIGNLGLTNSLLKLTRGEFVHEDLEYQCQSLKYSLEPEDFAPKDIELIPLWESESSITGVSEIEGEFRYIHYYVDSIESYKIIAKSIEGLINHLVDEFAENERESDVHNLLHT